MSDTDKRKEISFVKEALSAFNFLVTDFGFRFVRADPPFLIRYESEKFYVELYHDKISYEIEFRIGGIAQLNKESFTINELIRLNKQFSEDHLIWFQASTKQSVKECIVEMAKLIEDNVDPICFRDPLLLEKLTLIRNRLSSKTQKEYERQGIVEEAEKAWHSKDYVKLVKLYSPISDCLTPSEVWRLKYARKKIG